MTISKPRYRATVAYPRNSDQISEISDGETIEQAERSAVDQSAVNTVRKVYVQDYGHGQEWGPIVKGPYTLRAER